MGRKDKKNMLRGEGGKSPSSRPGETAGKQHEKQGAARPEGGGSKQGYLVDRKRAGTGGERKWRAGSPMLPKESAGQPRGDPDSRRTKEKGGGHTYENGWGRKLARLCSKIIRQKVRGEHVPDLRWRGPKVGASKRGTDVINGRVKGSQPKRRDSAGHD